MTDQIEWLKPSLLATDTRYIVAKYNVYYDSDDEYHDEVEVEMDLIRFNGIINQWKRRNGSDISYKEIICWIPVPD